MATQAGPQRVAVHLGVVDGGRDPNMEPSLKLMVLIHGHSSSGQDENLDQEAHTLILHMDRYNEAPNLCRTERSCDSVSPFTVDASDLDHMDGIDDDDDGNIEGGGDGDDPGDSQNMVLDSDDDDAVGTNYGSSRSGRQYAALEAHWLSRLLLPGILLCHPPGRLRSTPEWRQKAISLSTAR